MFWYTIYISGFTLKLLALILMFFEHSTDYLGDIVPFLDTLYFPAHYLGRLVAPIFFFLTVEGFFKTRSSARYLGRIGIWLIITGILSILAMLFAREALGASDPWIWGDKPNNPIFKSFWYFSVFLMPLGHNIFTSIFWGILMITCIEKSKETSAVIGKIIYIICAIFSGLGMSALSEASVYGLGLYLIFYFCYEKNKRLVIFYVLFQLLSLYMTISAGREMGEVWGSLKINFEYLQIFALPFLLMYNGKRGKYSWKYFFYAFYPLHLVVLFLLKWTFL